MNTKSLLASVAMAAVLPVLAMADTAANKSTAIAALTATLGKGDIAAVDHYFDPAYVQHNPDIANGTEALKGLITALHDSGTFKSETVRVIADDDLVAFRCGAVRPDGQVQLFGDFGGFRVRPISRLRIF